VLRCYYRDPFVPHTTPEVRIPARRLPPTSHGHQLESRRAVIPELAFASSSAMSLAADSLRPVRPLPPDTRAAIVGELRKGQLYSEICDRHQVSKNAVSKIAIKAGLRRNDRPGMLTAAQAAEMVSRYQSGERARDIAAAFGVSPDLVWETLRRSGVAARTPGTVPQPLRHDALDVLTPDAAYWCGFIFTDGTINRRTGNRRTQQPEIAVVLQRRDRDHLVKLRDFLGSAHAITPDRASHRFPCHRQTERRPWHWRIPVLGGLTATRGSPHWPWPLRACRRSGASCIGRLLARVHRRRRDGEH
jgi:hypothetical protein